MKKIKFKFILSLTLIFALALPLFIMPISASDEDPTIEELVELAKEAELYLDMLYEYRIYDGEEYDSFVVDSVKKYRDLAIEMGYYTPGYKIESFLTLPHKVKVISTGEIEELDVGMAFRFADNVTVEKVKKDIEKYFVSNFLNILYEKSGDYPLIYLSPDGYLCQSFTGLNGMPGHWSILPDFNSAVIKEKSENKITLEFDSLYGEESENTVSKTTIQYTKTNRGWRISGATGGYYSGYTYGRNEVFAPEVPDTADNSVVYIALASVSLVALAGVTLVSAKKKKAYIA